MKADDYFIYNKYSGMYFSVETLDSFQWTAAPTKIKSMSIKEAKRIRDEHFAKWEEELWIVLFEPKR